MTYYLCGYGGSRSQEACPFYEPAPYRNGCMHTAFDTDWCNSLDAQAEADREVEE